MNQRTTTRRVKQMIEALEAAGKTVVGLRMENDGAVSALTPDALSSHPAPVTKAGISCDEAFGCDT